jgi:hypothetical protein
MYVGLSRYLCAHVIGTMYLLYWVSAMSQSNRATTDTVMSAGDKHIPRASLTQGAKRSMPLSGFQQCIAVRRSQLVCSSSACMLLSIL